MHFALHAENRTGYIRVFGDRIHGQVQVAYSLLPPAKVADEKFARVLLAFGTSVLIKTTMVLWGTKNREAPSVIPDCSTRYDRVTIEVTSSRTSGGRNNASVLHYWVINVLSHQCCSESIVTVIPNSARSVTFEQLWNNRYLSMRMDFVAVDLPISLSRVGDIRNSLYARSPLSHKLELASVAKGS